MFAEVLENLTACSVFSFFLLLFASFRSADIYRVISVTSDTSVEEIMIQALEKFGLDSSDINKFRLSEVTLDKGCTYRSSHRAHVKRRVHLEPAAAMSTFLSLPQLFMKE